MKDTDPTAATRTLMWEDGEVRRDILVKIGIPRSFGDDYACDAMISGMPEPVQISACGIDALQALLLVITAVRDRLQSVRSNLIFLDTYAYHGIPFIPPTLDVDEEEYVERLVTSELEHFTEILSRGADRFLLQDQSELGLAAIGDPKTLSVEELEAALRATVSPQQRIAAKESQASVAITERQRLLVTELRRRFGAESTGTRLANLGIRFDS